LEISQKTRHLLRFVLVKQASQKRNFSVIASLKKLPSNKSGALYSRVFK